MTRARNAWKANIWNGSLGEWLNKRHGTEIIIPCSLHPPPAQPKCTGSLFNPAMVAGIRKDVGKAEVDYNRSVELLG